jgi:hypothetical protein
MKTSFTDFKLSFSIKDNTNDTEYASIMRGVLKELYTIFGIALVRDTEQHSETITLEHDTETQLIHKNIKELSIDHLGTYVEGTDYVVNYEEGTITSLSSGSIPNNQSLTINYFYYVFINESDTLTLEIFPRQNKTKYFIGIKPYTLNKVTYEGSTLTEDYDYYFYNNKFELLSEPTNLRKPYLLDLNVGYDIVPDDLRMAFYELIKLRYDRRKAKADIISRVQDVDGSETTYRESSIPKHLSDIFYSYSGRSLAMVG